MPSRLTALLSYHCLFLLSALLFPLMLVFPAIHPSPFLPSFPSSFSSSLPLPYLPFLISSILPFLPLSFSLNLSFLPHILSSLPSFLAVSLFPFLRFLHPFPHFTFAFSHFCLSCHISPCFFDILLSYPSVILSSRVAYQFLLFFLSLLSYPPVIISSGLAIPLPFRTPVLLSSRFPSSYLLVLLFPCILILLC